MQPLTPDWLTRTLAAYLRACQQHAGETAPCGRPRDRLACPLALAASLALGVPVTLDYDRAPWLVLAVAAGEHGQTWWLASPALWTLVVLIDAAHLDTGAPLTVQEVQRLWALAQHDPVLPAVRACDTPGERLSGLALLAPAVASILRP